MTYDEHPDQASERHQALDEEDLYRERREDRLGDYTPADSGFDYQGSGSVDERSRHCMEGQREADAAAPSPPG